VYNVAIIGAGNIGAKRARAVAKHPQSRVGIIASRTRSKAESLAAQYGAEVAPDWESVIARPDIDVVVVSTTNDMLCTIVCAAAANGKAVLCEKPLGRNRDEARQMVAAFENPRRLKVGFNYRFHPAIQKAKSLLQDKEIGKLIFLRARYGTGGRPGLENEWRAKKEIAGGGELLDQGVHICDLFRWFCEEEFCEYHAMIGNLFWQMENEDNAMALMRTQAGIMAQFHVSWTQWKNIFSVDIFGEDGYILLNGLGGNYGIETLTLAKRRPESGPPDQTHNEFAGEDLGWEKEWAHFIHCLSHDILPCGNAFDGLAATEMVHCLYTAASDHRTVHRSTAKVTLLT
jgi:predicted dehydrogenase